VFPKKFFLTTPVAQPYWAEEVRKGWAEDEICDELRRLKEDIVLWEGDIEATRPRAHPLFFGDVESSGRRGKAFDVLDKVADGRGSLFTFSAVLDSWQHNGPVQESCGWPRLLRRTNADLMLLKEWADDHPDYLLVLMSDHGQNKRVPDYVLHGEGGKGNDGVLFLYNSQLVRRGKYDGKAANHTDLPFLHVADIAATIVSVMPTVDFPLTSIGVSHAGLASHHLSREPIVRPHTLCRNLVQLVRSAELRGVAPSTRQKAMSVIKEVVGGSMLSSPKVIGRLDAVAFELREHLLSDAKQSRWTQIGCIVVIAIVFASTLLGANPTARSFKRYLNIPTMFHSLAPMCFGLTEFAFSWYGWGSYYTAGTPFFVALAVVSVALWALVPQPENKRSRLLVMKIVGVVMLLVTTTKVVRHTLGLDIEPPDPHEIPSSANDTGISDFVGPTEPGIFVLSVSVILSAILSTGVIWLLALDSQTIGPVIPHNVRRLLAGAILWGDLFGRMQSWSWFFLPTFFGPLYGIHVCALFAYVCLAASVLQIIWNVVRTRFVDRGLNDFCHGIAAVCAVYSWMLYQDSVMARVTLLVGWWTCGIALGDLFASTPPTRHVLAVLAVTLVLILSTQITPLDFNAQADFSRWGLFANGKRLPIFICSFLTLNVLRSPYYSQRS
jgi:hypothetical protein